MTFFEFVILIIVVLLFVLFLRKPRRKVWIDPTNAQFADEYKAILLSDRALTDRFDLAFVEKNNADIKIHLIPRHKMIELSGAHEKYDDGSPIYFSWTYQKPSPTIFIDEENWTNGVPRSDLSVDNYRKYVAKHEFLHALGYDHQPCNDKVCPIMYQATRGPPTGKQCGFNITDADWMSRIAGSFY